MDNLHISGDVSLDHADIRITQIRAGGPGGQHVNKVSTAVHLRFDIDASSLPDYYKARLRATADQRITDDGVVIIKASRFRSVEKNRSDAVERLVALIRDAGRTRKARKATRPGGAAKRRRLDAKARRSRTKTLRKRPDFDD